MIGADTTFLVQLEAVEHPDHESALALLHREIVTPSVPLGIAPMVIAEFLHIVTDSRRFSSPLSMEVATRRARYWWSCHEVTHVFPNSESLSLTLDWIDLHRLGRKRILDTQLAAAYWAAGIKTVITSNPSDFKVLGLQTIQP